jgi:hypothetical protein
VVVEKEVERDLPQVMIDHHVRMLERKGLVPDSAVRAEEADGPDHIRSVKVMTGHSGTSLSMTINQYSSACSGLGFYYNFQNLNLGNIADGTSITIAGTGTYGVNLYLNPYAWTWGPTSSPSIQIWTGLDSIGSYGLGSTPSPTTINGAYTFTNFNANGCVGSYTITQLADDSVCTGISASTPFALWIGVGPIGPGDTPPATVTATITGISSSPYPPTP